MSTDTDKKNVSLKGMGFQVFGIDMTDINGCIGVKKEASHWFSNNIRCTDDTGIHALYIDIIFSKKLHNT